tara:strand:- start:1330 stop:4176 length:2847 start_codon:yes stop_codon:yes gene_type:complete
MISFGADFSAQDLDFFEQKIRPLFVENCYKCHSSNSKKLKGGLRMDHRDGVLKGGDTGPAIVAGKPEQSLLIEAVRYNNVDLEMPPRGKLSESQIDDLTQWVKRGAPWPAENNIGGGAAEEFNLQERKAKHWAWGALNKNSPPAVKRKGWASTPVDQFILAELEGAGLQPTGPAAKRTLIRRAYFDLIGLPPTPEQVEIFLSDNSPRAFEKVIDGLLASPHFGERWGRHWLDLMRYAETFGHEFDFVNQDIWRYRDYVIRAFNQDVPYDRLILEHIAGDQITPRYAKEGGWNESRLATTWWWMGQHCHSPVDVRAYQAEIIDNQIDVLTKSFQAMTVACARCHDHKFDAISTADYYSLYGLVKSSSFSHGSVDGQQAFIHKKEELTALKKKIATALGDSIKTQPVVNSEVKTDGYTLITDIRQTKGKDWFADGTAWRDAFTVSGDFTIEGQSVRPVLADWLHGALVSRKFQGTLRSPTFTIAQNFIHILALGTDVRFNVVVDNFKVIRNPIYGSLTRNIKNDKPHWVTFNLGMWKGHDCYLEIVDLSSSDPGGRGSGPDAYGAVQQLWLSDNNRPPSIPVPKLSEPVRLTQGDAPKLLAEYNKLAGSIARPAVVPVMLEGSGRNENLFIRGSHKNPGKEIQRGYLTAIVGENQASVEGTGRLELARHIADPSNPLTARVYVNRIWHHLFGRGIVPSTDNFGVLGEKPSHPQLLDWLANRLIEKKWSTKQLIREVMLSQTYQMSSKPVNAANEAKDPANILLHRMPVRRLQGEAIRDAILAVSGRLDKKMYGAPVSVHLTAFMEGRGRPGRSGPLDGAGRRTIYQEVRRNFLSPMMLAFDMPQPLSTFGRRTTSNVPAQSLIMMNDPFVVEQSKLWAKRILGMGNDDNQRVMIAYQLAFGRQPDQEETLAARAFLTTQAKDHGEAQPGEKAWSDLCHGLFNVKEFIFLH